MRRKRGGIGGRPDLEARPGPLLSTGSWLPVF